MAVNSEFPKQHTHLILKDFEEDFFADIPTDKIIQLDLDQFKPERRVYARSQILFYQRKIDTLQTLNHPEMKPEYIQRINQLILSERGEITE